MKLILTSDGLSNKKLQNAFVGLLEKKVQEARVLVVHTAQKPEHMVFVDGVGRELSKSGILLPNIGYLNIAENKNRLGLADYHAVYICGGNTYFILDRLRKTGLVQPIKKFVSRGGVYIGVSAGSIIAGQEISIAGWGSVGDSNEIGLTDLRGLGFTDIAVYPHYEPHLKGEVTEYATKFDRRVEILKDGEGLLIEGKSVRRV